MPDALTYFLKHFVWVGMAAFFCGVVGGSKPATFVTENVPPLMTPEELADYGRTLKNHAVWSLGRSRSVGFAINSIVFFKRSAVPGSVTVPWVSASGILGARISDHWFHLRSSEALNIHTLTRSHVYVLAVCTVLMSGHRCGLADDAVPSNPAPRWWKGNLHTHSLWSDGDDFPEMIAEWYRTKNYHFLAISDHNVLSQGQRWMKVDDVLKRGGADVIDKYKSRFGGEWVELRTSPEAVSEVRLKPFEEFRSLVEERGKFLLIPSEEISDHADGKPVHINAANLVEAIEPQRGKSVRETIANNFRAILEQEKAKGREVLPHLNHPNFGWAVTAEDLAFVTTDRFYEVYNGHPAINHLGDATRPSVERIWDIANTIRLVQLNAAPLFGLGTDDSHHYHGTGGSRPGRGWVMVRSKYLSPEMLILAMKRGDFYASSGVTLSDVTFDPITRTVSLRIEPQSNANYKTEFIGTKKKSDAQKQNPDDPDALPSLEEIGRIMATSDSLTPSYALTADDLYIRAVVTSTTPAADPSFDDQKQQAWTQPVGWNRGEDAPPSND